MSDDSKKKGEPVDGVVYHECPNGRMHRIGTVEGILMRDGDPGETVYEDKNSSFVGGGNPLYAANYDRMNWN